MILYVLSYRNKGIKAFSQPHYVDIDPEKCAVQLTRALGLAPASEREKFKRLQLYCLGTFEDETGKFTLYDEPEYLLDCDEIPVIAEPEIITIKKEGKKDEQSA